ncbi:MAG: lipopolysaccharide biosynthesis protein [Xanthomonadaceae bacterium]|nr:lipopolysaccharide biosynthesis protein [Xanthomonadaceae bacterium]
MSSTTTTLEKRAASAAWWSALEIIARYGVQFVVMVVLAHLLAPSDFGLIAILLIFTSIGILLVDSGFGSALIQRQTTTDDDETTVFIFTVTIGVAAAGTLVLFAPAISTFFNEPKLIKLLRAMAVVLPLGAFAAVPDALLTMKLNFKARARAEVVASFCSGAVAVVLALRGFGVWSMAWQSIVSIGVRGILLWLYSGWRPRGHYRGASFCSLFGFGGYMLLSGLLSVTAARLQSVMIGKLFDSRTLGFYAMAQNTQSAPASIMGQLLNRVGLPVFSTLVHDREKLTSALRTSLRIAMFLFVPSMMGIAVVAHPLIEMLYGARWLPAAPILSVLAAGAALWPVHVLNLAAISAQGRSDLFFRLEVIKQIAGIVLVVAFAHWGPLAIAWSVLIAGLFSAALNTHYSKKLLDYGWLAQLTDQWPTLLLSSVAVLVGWVVLRFHLTGPVNMIAAITASATTYMLLAILTKNKALSELLSMLNALFSDRLSRITAQKIDHVK